MARCCQNPLHLAATAVRRYQSRWSRRGGLSTDFQQRECLRQMQWHAHHERPSYLQLEVALLPVAPRHQSAAGRGRRGGKQASTAVRNEMENRVTILAQSKGDQENSDPSLSLPHCLFQSSVLSCRHTAHSSDTDCNLVWGTPRMYVSHNLFCLTFCPAPSSSTRR